MHPFSISPQDWRRTRFYFQFGGHESSSVASSCRGSCPTLSTARSARRCWRSRSNGAGRRCSTRIRGAVYSLRADRPIGGRGRGREHGWEPVVTTLSKPCSHGRVTGFARSSTLLGADHPILRQLRVPRSSINPCPRLHFPASRVFAQEGSRRRSSRRVSVCGSRDLWTTPSAGFVFL
jgi:hypothetical protein